MLAQLLILAIGSLLVFLAFGLPVAIAMIMTSVLLKLLYCPNLSLTIFPFAMFSKLNSEILLAIPFFILVGNMCSKGELSKRLITLVKTIFGFLPGAPLVIMCVSCMLFGAISGSTVATLLAIGGVMLPILKNYKYPKETSIGLLTTSSTLGILVPPSTPMVLYSFATGVSIKAIFLAGYLPALFLCGSFCIYSIILGIKKGERLGKFASFKEVLSAIKQAAGVMSVILIIFVGIFGGIFTPTEAAAVSVVYCIFLELFVYRSTNVKEIAKLVLDSGLMVGIILFIVAASGVLGEIIAVKNVPSLVAEAVINIAKSNISMFLLIVSIVLLIAGTLMEVYSIILIFIPLFFPIAVKFGLDPLHFGIICVVAMQIAAVTPPVGLNLYTAAAAYDMSITKVIKSILVPLSIMLITWFLIIFFPNISTYLPKILFFK